MSKSNRSKLQSAIKDIKKGFSRLFWYNYLNIKYFLLNLKKFFFNYSIKKFTIGVLYPTRERSQKFERMLITMSDNCFDKKRINIFLLFDSDEPEYENYLNIINNKLYSDFTFKIFIKDLKNHAQRNNFLASESKDEILFPVNDDIILKSKNWDLVIDKEFSKIKSNLPYCVWPDAGQKYTYLHSDFPIVNRSWFNRLGYISSDIFNHWYFDTWICDLCKKSRKFHITPFIKIFQFSAHSIKEEVDKTHLRNANNDKAEKDKILWINSNDKRKLDSNKLLN